MFESPKQIRKYVDYETLPVCDVMEEHIDMGYRLYRLSPRFELPECNAPKDSLEYTIELYGLNNFSTQLTRLYNLILNHQESEIENYPGEPIDHRALADRARTMLNENEHLLAPWDKYPENSIWDEEHIIDQLEVFVGQPLPYAKVSKW